jgi:hypothetical protein
MTTIIAQLIVVLRENANLLQNAMTVIHAQAIVVSKEYATILPLYIAMIIILAQTIHV